MLVLQTPSLTLSSPYLATQPVPAGTELVLFPKHTAALRCSATSRGRSECQGLSRCGWGWGKDLGAQ